MSRAADLDRDSRQALEFDELLDWVAGHARTAAGAEAVRGSVPTADLAALEGERAAVAELGRHLAAEGALIRGALPDVRRAVGSLAVAGTWLGTGPLRELATVARALSELRDVLLALEPDGWPRLAATARELADFEGEADVVLDGIDSEGRIEDHASRELAEIRLGMRRVAARVRSILTGMLQAPDAESVIQDDFITERNGRYVVPVRTDTPRRVEGIVHARSSSGASRFIEPLATIELNNELVSLGEQEQEEQERILRRWTAAFRDRRDELERSLDVLARVDAWQARARFGELQGGVLAEVTEGGPLRLEGMRHPLLDRHLRATGGRCVPLDLTLEPAGQVLLISGPNTGGKTVALKTVGLAALMAQSAIPLPARIARLPCYRQVRADVGDHQSIEADLSTFSAHVRAVVAALTDLEAPALLLFDEIGTGTEPAEGAALAQAVLEELQRPGLTTVATTHLAALKAWAFAGEGAACAAMEFDAGSLQPTYRVLMGVSGTSAALEIASQLGMPPAIIERARERLGPGAAEAAGYLERLREQLSRVEDEREAALERERLREAERAGERREAERQAERLRREAGEALDRALEELRRAARKEFDAIHDERERERVRRRADRAMLRVERDHARRREELAPPSGPAPRADWRVAERVAAGQTVWVPSLGQEAEVLDARGGQAELRVGALRLTLPLSELRVAPEGGRAAAGGGGATPAAVLAQRGAARGALGTGSVEDRPPAPRELKLLGLSVDEALDALDRFLDAAVLAGHEEVRVVHGHGTGKLRAAVRSALAAHRSVQRWRPGARAEGGDGATIATL